MLHHSQCVSLSAMCNEVKESRQISDGYVQFPFVREMDDKTRQQRYDFSKNNSRIFTVSSPSPLHTSRYDLCAIASLRTKLTEQAHTVKSILARRCSYVPLKVEITGIMTHMFILVLVNPIPSDRINVRLHPAAGRRLNLFLSLELKVLQTILCFTIKCGTFFIL